MSNLNSLFSGFAGLWYWLLIVGVTLRILIKRRTLSATIAWLLVVHMIPFVGVIAYILFGEVYLGKTRVERARAMWPKAEGYLKELKANEAVFVAKVSDVARPLFQLCERQYGLSGMKGSPIQLFNTSTETMNMLIHDMNQAKHSIEIVFYIWQSGGLADQVAETLMAAAKRGVNCRLMLDSAGSRSFFQSDYPEKMRQAGIEVVESLKVNIFRFFLRRIDLRQHRKIVLIDNRITYTGSMNMVDPRYFKQDAGVGEWIDLMARMEGPVTSMLGIVYGFDWEVETGKNIYSNKLQCAPLEEEGSSTLQLIPSGPGFPEDMLHQAFLMAIYGAREELVMTTPYFVPSDDLLLAICTAALRGVDVSIIVPKKNDSMMVSWTSRSFFTELLAAGVKIYQFEGGLLHTKSVLVDKQLSLFGTANLDMRSLWLNLEITLVIDDDDFGQMLADVQDGYIEHSVLLDEQVWLKRPVWHKLFERLFYFVSPLL